MSQSKVLIDMRPLQGPSARRGIGRYARGLLGGLISAGFDTSLDVLIHADLAEPELPSGAYGIHRVRRRYKGTLAAYEDAAVLGADLARIRPALYHAVTPSLPARAPCPVVVTLHDMIPWALSGRYVWGERARQWIGRHLLRRADRVIAVSQATAADATRLARIDKAQLRVVGEGVDTEFKPAAGAAERVAMRWRLDRPYLFYQGALDQRKDPAALLQAWRTAKAAGASTELVLAGDPGRQAPRGMAGANQLGYVSNPDLVDLLSAACCLLYPSRYEGFGLPILEAMACGCPVITYRNSSLTELADRAAMLVDDGDAEAMGRAAAELVLEPERRRGLRTAGLERAALFTWPKAAQQTIAVYVELLRRDSSSL
jgi:glycosyltransferase involved in cell wall biosynthesis